MIIYKSDSENVRKSKRIANLVEQEQAYKNGAMEPLTGPQQLAIRAGIEQAKQQLKPWDYVLYDTAFTNGELRIRYQNGHHKYEYHMGFAGRARSAEQMNIGE